MIGWMRQHIFVMLFITFMVGLLSGCVLFLESNRRIVENHQTTRILYDGVIGSVRSIDKLLDLMVSENAEDIERHDRYYINAKLKTIPILQMADRQ